MIGDSQRVPFTSLSALGAELIIHTVDDLIVAVMVLQQDELAAAGGIGASGQIVFGNISVGRVRPALPPL